MKIWSDSFADGAPIPTQYAFGKHDPDTHVTLSDNLSPHLAWSDLPQGTKSLAITCIDVDVPSVGDDVNQEGKTVPAELPRVPFFHWAMANLDPAAGSVAEGAYCKGVTARGKDGPEGPGGCIHAMNNYTQWFAGDADMDGQYYGYDGPCPPWNDAIIHHYHFTVYALGVSTISLPDDPDGGALLQAIEAYTLGTASMVGTYHINPSAG